MTARAVAIYAICKAADWLHAQGVELPSRLALDLYRLTKTYDHYAKVIDRATREFYAGSITDSEFLDVMIGAIEEQLTRAWYAGMRQNGLSAPADMTPEWEGQLKDIIDGEYNRVLDFASAIQSASEKDAANGTPDQSLPALRSRGALWANRYNDVVNQSVTATAQAAVEAPAEGEAPDEARLRWNFDPDKEHCLTCEALNGIVATVSDWQDSGFTPQAPPNDMLECGGWRCGCSLEFTTEPVNLPDGSTIADVVAGYAALVGA